MKNHRQNPSMTTPDGLVVGQPPTILGPNYSRTSWFKLSMGV